MKNKIYISFLLLSISLMWACNPTDFELVDPNDSQTPLVATHTIAEFIADYATTTGNVFPVRTNSGNSNVFSVDSIPSIGEPIVITGTVISTDVEGSFYKNFIIQDTLTGDALKVSVDVGSFSGVSPLGQSISIKCNGLAIGKYGDLLQLGTVYYNNDTDTRKRGFEPGRIPYSQFKLISTYNGMPRPESIKVDTMTIAQIKSSDRSVHSKIVCIKDVRFNGKGEVNFTYKQLTAKEVFFGLPKPSYTGVPIAREIEDRNGNKIYISTSEYAKFATAPIPADNVYGDITVIVGWYRDKEINAGSWQLTIRSLDDLGRGFESYHSEN
ncbi:MAG: hypothetical protein AUK44_07230 [Porphyromonadaceae bacterium CG2_30_38_12]|nr:MAG: hypothetical protein AUK44_07230 [Porphyromonadaceae bacterium CG2_30_38_12]